MHAAKKEFDKTGNKIDDVYVEGNKVIPRRNNTISRGNQGQLDHIISAEEIHNDPARVLSGIDGKELANCPDNLCYTNAALNLNMSNMSAEEYIQWCENNPDKVNYNGEKGKALPEDVKKKLLSEYSCAKKQYDAKLAKAYYTSSRFLKDTTKAAGQLGIQMGIRQALGFIFIEIYLGAKKELQEISCGTDLKQILEAAGEGIKNGFQNAKKKYKDIITKIEEGFTAGILSSLSTTICNIFFTTAKNLVKSIRQIYASIVQAGKVLLFNPDDLMLGDRIKTATVILATGASVLVGTFVGEMIEKTPIGMSPIVGKVCSTFCATLVSGLLSCSFVIFLDRSKFINFIIDGLNAIPTEVCNYKAIADMMEVLAAKWEKIDIEKFRSDAEKYRKIATRLVGCECEDDINNILLLAHKEFDIQVPWKGDFESFMRNKSNRLVFG